MPKLVKLFLPALVLFFLCPHLRAQDEPKWESHGPYGGLIFGIQVDETNPKRLLAWTFHGHFLSNDAGATWRPVQHPESEKYLRYRCTPRMIFSGGKLYCGRSGSIYISENGKSWEKQADLGSHIEHLTCEPGKPEEIWCLFVEHSPSSGRSIRVAKKEPKNWEAIKVAQKPQSPEGGFWCHLAISPVDPKILRVFLAPHKPGNKTHVFSSQDGGKTWGRWTINCAPFASVFSSTEPKTIYAAAKRRKGIVSGLIKSTDGGKTWESLVDAKKVGDLRFLFFHPKTGHLFLGSEDKGLFKTTNFGKTVVKLNEGLHNKSVYTVAADPADTNTLYAGTQCGLFKSADGGKNWKWISEGIAACQIAGVATFEHEPDRICVFEQLQGVRTSTDGGRTWGPVDEWGGKYGRLTYARHGAKTVLVATPAGEGYKTLLSRNSGRTWKAVKNLGKRDHPVAVISNTEMYAVRDRLYLLKSTDGLLWKEFGGPFHKVGGALPSVLRPKGKDYLLIVGYNGIEKCDASTGKRLGTIKVPADLFPVYSAQIFEESDPELLYVGAWKGEIMKCDLRTQKWTKLYTHESKYGDYLDFCGVVFDPGKKERVIAAFGDGHMAISEDSGRTWKPLKPEVPFFEIRHTAVTAKRILVIAGNGSIHTLDLSKIK